MLEALAAFGLDFLGKKQEQRWAKQAAGRQMDFQERMSNTAYQRAMSDMYKAGINPIMAAKLGGASTPTGAMASTPKLGNIGSNAVKNIATAKQMQLTDAQISKTNATTALEKAKANEINQKVSSGYWQAVSNNLSQQDRKISTEILNIMANTSATRLSNTIKNWEFSYFKNERGYPSQVLITTMENGMKTDLYHSMSKDKKLQYFATVKTALDKVMSNADEVVKDPGGYLKANFPPLVVSGLMLILPGIFKRATNKRTIIHKSRKDARHGKNRNR